MGVATDALRAKIRALEGGPVGTRRRVVSGVGVLDHLLGGLPSPGILELTGPRGGGSTRLVAALVASWTCRGERVAWLDLQRVLYPPALDAFGVVLTHLFVVRPPEHEITWAAEQVIRSGCFPLVVVAEPVCRGRTGQRWALAAEVGGTLVVVMNRHRTRSLPACVRLLVRRDSLTVQRNRGGAFGAVGPLPPWPLRCSIWGDSEARNPMDTGE